MAKSKSKKHSFTVTVTLDEESKSKLVAHAIRYGIKGLFIDVEGFYTNHPQITKVTVSPIGES